MANQYTIVGGSALPYFQVNDAANNLYQTFPKSEYTVSLSGDDIVIAHISGAVVLSLDFDNIVSPLQANASALYAYLITNQYFFKSASSSSLIPKVVQDFSRVDDKTINILYSDASTSNLTIYTPSAGTSVGNTLVWNGTSWVESTFTSAGVWLNGGNTWAANSSIGNISNHNLSFITNNTARMSIDNTGNVNVLTNLTLPTSTSSVGCIIQNGAIIFTTRDTQNIIIGKNAGFTFNGGVANVFVGENAGYYTTTASTNVVVGVEAGFGTGVASTYSDCVAIGWRAGFKLTTGIQNVFVGRAAGYENTTGSYNTYLGYGAGWLGAGSSSSVAIGWSALNANTGAGNIAIGQSAGINTTSGNANIFIGLSNGYDNTTGSANILIGANAGINDQGYVAGGSYQSIFGSATYPIQHLYFNGIQNAAVNDVALHGAGAFGTDINGGNLTIAGGKGTGAGTVGSIIFQTTTIGSTSATLQTLTERMRITDSRVVFNAGIDYKVTVTTVDLTLNNSHYIVIASGDGLNITLPASPIDGQFYIIYFDNALNIVGTGLTIIYNGNSINYVAANIVNSVSLTATKLFWSATQANWLIIP